MTAIVVAALGVQREEDRESLQTVCQQFGDAQPIPPRAKPEGDLSCSAPILSPIRPRPEMSLLKTVSFNT
jgi:hypothetical protein